MQLPSWSLCFVCVAFTQLLFLQSGWASQGPGVPDGTASPLLVIYVRAMAFLIIALVK
jgi:hypothetical protein